MIRTRRSAYAFSHGLPTAAVLIATPRATSRSGYAGAAYFNFTLWWE